jgi:hypothetical protein
MINGTYWGNYARGLLQFCGDGTIVADNGTTAIGNYQTGEWYHVQVHYELDGATLYLTYVINGVSAGEITNSISNLSQEQSLDHVDLDSDEGSAYFDNLHVYTAAGGD